MAGGNPYHDGRGKFTTSGHDGSNNVNPVRTTFGLRTGQHAVGAADVHQAMKNVAHRKAVAKQQAHADGVIGRGRQMVTKSLYVRKR